MNEKPFEWKELDPDSELGRFINRKWKDFLNEKVDAFYKSLEEADGIKMLRLIQAFSYSIVYYEGNRIAEEIRDAVFEANKNSSSFEEDWNGELQTMKEIKREE